MIYLIATIKERKTEYMRTYNRLIEMGVPDNDIIIDFGYRHIDVPTLKKDFHLLLYRFIKDFVPMMIERGEDLVYLEDNVYPLKRVDEIEIDYEKINWLGYIFNQKSFICGIKYVYFPISILKEIPTKVQWQHIDRWLKNYAEKNNILKIDKNYIKLYRSVSCWGTSTQKIQKERLKERLYLD